MSGYKAAHIHAYLHRKEGDQCIAEYWYRQVKKSVFVGTLDSEWDSLWSVYGDT